MGVHGSVGSAQRLESLAERVACRCRGHRMDRTRQYAQRSRFFRRHTLTRCTSRAARRSGWRSSPRGTATGFIRARCACWRAIPRASLARQVQLPVTRPSFTTPAWYSTSRASSAPTSPRCSRRESVHRLGACAATSRRSPWQFQQRTRRRILAGSWRRCRPRHADAVRSTLVHVGPGPISSPNWVRDRARRRGSRK